MFVCAHAHTHAQAYYYCMLLAPVMATHSACICHLPTTHAVGLSLLNAPRPADLEENKSVIDGYCIGIEKLHRMLLFRLIYKPSSEPANHFYLTVHRPSPMSHDTSTTLGRAGLLSILLVFPDNTHCISGCCPGWLMAASRHFTAQKGNQNRSGRGWSFLWYPRIRPLH